MARVVQSGGSREPYWRMVLARWKRSGLSVQTFCRAEGLNQRIGSGTGNVRWIEDSYMPVPRGFGRCD